jgi:hypothetical protein
VFNISEPTQNIDFFNAATSPLPMGHAGPQADGLAQILQRNLTYDDISPSMHCSKREIRQVAKQ